MELDDDPRRLGRWGRMQDLRTSEILKRDYTGSLTFIALEAECISVDHDW